jgi:hypothetical protein
MLSSSVQPPGGAGYGPGRDGLEMKNDARQLASVARHRRPALPEASVIELPRGFLSTGKRWQVFGLASFRL